MSDRNEQRVVHESGWDPDSETDPTVAVVSTVAAAEECDPLELPPLYETIDTNALNRLVSPTANGGADRIMFRYCGYEVLVRRSGVQLRTLAAQS
ncbi:hypothetical protein Htur_3782 (plasmid) [Haloterrigena turkmenica DSM 5511]|uniref:Halobacterial output domain-containing protein n=1 Tax=Haloterrigena turkmenica (strain ATCC 51198 / DSM 5511 / JCM 9101 / NCIMB 13204 / VKM B-1734 / 4k) TaxID=543526 RepID=D2RZU7_HALTV|nr:HalOD1 output domain-containing protein [Haloterrigena turkmenica]ADB62644.1 hypothetical protein Htur_3782 [Haloterrigena turkmenica DSM 5511]